MAACPDGGAPIACDGPSECAAQTPYCCGTLTLGPGTAPACPVTAVASTCVAQCSSHFTTSCPGTNIARLCVAPADCADDPANPNCCTFKRGINTVTMCVADLLKPYATQCL
jgi:hypothetical protein